MNASSSYIGVSPTEYAALTTGCGLFDRSERGKLALTGPDAKTFLTGQVTNDIEVLTSGQGRYAAFLTHKGKMLGDIRVLDVESELWLDTERVSLQALFDRLRQFKIGYDVELEKRTLERGLLSLIGPKVRELLKERQLANEEHANRRDVLNGMSVLLVVTDLGIDVICDSGDTDNVKDLLMSDGAVSVSEATAECLRIEHGRPRYGIDMDDTTIPQEAGLNERAVSFEKGCYVGQETVARLYYKGKPNRFLRGLRLTTEAANGDDLQFSDRSVGKLGSFTISPRFGPIGLALVRREVAVGDSVSVGIQGTTAKVTELPFGK